MKTVIIKQNIKNVSFAYILHMIDTKLPKVKTCI